MWEFECPECQQLAICDGGPGQVVYCEHCRSRVPVPAEAEAVAPQAVATARLRAEQPANAGVIVRVCRLCGAENPAGFTRCQICDEPFEGPAQNQDSARVRLKDLTQVFWLACAAYRARFWRLFAAANAVLIIQSVAMIVAFFGVAYIWPWHDPRLIVGGIGTVIPALIGSRLVLRIIRGESLGLSSLFVLPLGLILVLVAYESWIILDGKIAEYFWILRERDRSSQAAALWIVEHGADYLLYAVSVVFVFGLAEPHASLPEVLRKTRANLIRNWRAWWLLATSVIVSRYLGREMCRTYYEYELPGWRIISMIPTLAGLFLWPLFWVLYATLYLMTTGRAEELRLTIVTAPKPSGPRPAPPREICRVVDVLSDDIVLIVRGEQEPDRLRLCGVQCPDITQPFGTEARQFLETETHSRTFELDHFTRGETGELSAALVDGEFNLNRELCRRGLADAIEAKGADPELAKLAEDAETERVGIWSTPHPRLPPDEWSRLLEAARESAATATGDLRALQGVWTCVSAQWNGRETPASQGSLYLFAGDRLVILESPWRRERRFSIATDRREIDSIQEREGHPVRFSGLYELAGDRLLLCEAPEPHPRPTSLAPTEWGCNRVELRRYARAAVT